MKKLLVLMLVLGVASLANATLSLDVTVGGVDYDGSMLAPGTEVTVTVVQDVPFVNGSGGEVWVNFVGDPISIADTTPKYNIPTEWYGWNWLFNAGVSMLDVGDGSYQAWKGAAANPGVGTPGIGSIMNLLTSELYTSTWEFTFAATQDTALSFGGEWDSVVYDGACEEMVYVPEPMSMALLGLGGLLLRRKK